MSEKEKILKEIGQHIVNVHHIGSTAVKHLSVKPIIDIAVEIPECSAGEHCVNMQKEKMSILSR